ncbi:MAG: hypothetical protein A3E84_01945 [Gammaproteobacteria bacterium RIFCSPHIGHO2_12_FULL_42_13]|nr:MAG: hypothetical protein A3E84_01945 [Gammaproteobacteria bacterium RIFCSPHIGHO2_12_FULL_42_13]
MQPVIDKAKHIKLAIFDVDGVLTTGEVLYGAKGGEYKAFHIHDGFGIRLLQKVGIQIAIITAKESASVASRVLDLGIQHFYQGQENKVPAYEDIKQKLQLSDQQISYMGDDFPDIPLLRRAGLAITVPNAPDVMRQYTDYVTTHKSGKGAVREICDLILKAQDLYMPMLNSYLNQ